MKVILMRTKNNNDEYIVYDDDFDDDDDDDGDDGDGDYDYRQRIYFLNFLSLCASNTC